MERTSLNRIWRRLDLQPWQRNLCVVVVAETIAILGFSISIPFLPFYIQELGVSRFDEVAFWVGLIHSSAAASMALASPMWGLLADRYGRKPMLVRSLLGGGLLLGLMAAVTSVPQLATLRIIQAILAGSVPAATTLVATSVPRERCGYALGLLQTAIFVGHSLGPLVGGVVGAILGYRAAFLGASLLLSLAGILVLLLVHEEFVPSPERKGSAMATTVRSLMREPVLSVMVALLMVNNLSNAITQPVLPLYIQTLVPSAREATTATGLVVGATAMANALAAVWVGRTADRLGRQRVLLACLSVGALTHFPQMLTRHPIQLLVLRAVTGLALGGVAPVANALIAERAPEGHQGGIYGISASFNAFGRALGPMLGTLLITGWSVGSVFPATGALLGLVALLVTTTRSLDIPRRP